MDKTNTLNLKTANSKYIAKIIQQYDSQGFHRTATKVDQLSAFWLVQHIKKLGIEAQLQPFSLSRIDPVQAYIQIGQRRLEGLPLFDATFTDANGIQGKLGLAGSDGNLLVMPITPQANTPKYQELQTCRRSGKYQGIIAITHSIFPGLAPLNALEFTSPFGPAVLQVSTEEGRWLENAAQQGQVGTLVNQVQRTEAEAFNVIATLKGTDSTLAPVVIMTPRSGWWHCASERGGGLACWLSVLAALSVRRLARDVIFIATSGHELGGIGLEYFLGQQPMLAKKAKVWLHFGANLGAAFGKRCGLFASNREFAEIAAGWLEKAGAAPDDCYLPNSLPYGEALLIQRLGGAYISLLGANQLFHHPKDRFSEAVDIMQVTRFATAFTNLSLMFAKAIN